MHRHPFTAMACLCEVVLDGCDAGAARAAADAAIAEVRRIEAKYSRYRDDSVVSRINAAAGGAPVACDDETLALLRYADTLHRSSDGLFDITSGVLRRAWDWKAGRVPTDAELAPLLARVGWSRVERSGDTVRLPEPGMEIDFGGFGKEYAADRAGALLSGLGLAHGHVNLGGDLRVIGPKADGSPWRIGIRHPRRPGDLIATIPVHRGGLATSGDYERCIDVGGRRHCHILDPRSGRSNGHWQSVSVVAPLAVAAGNLSTLAMLRGGDAIDLLEAAGVSYLAVDHCGDVHQHGRRVTAASAAAPTATT